MSNKLFPSLAFTAVANRDSNPPLIGIAKTLNLPIKDLVVGLKLRIRVKSDEILRPMDIRSKFFWYFF